MRSSTVLTAFALALSGLTAVVADPLRVTGSTTVNPVVAETAETLREEAGLVIHVDTQGNCLSQLRGPSRTRDP